MVMTGWTNDSRCGAAMISRNNDRFPVSVAVSARSMDWLLSSFYHTLHPSEHTTMNGIAAHHYLLGRHAAKMAAQHFTNAPPGEIRISSGVFGQPVLSCAGHCNLQVSISHSNERAIAIVFPEQHPMAVDIESLDSIKHLPDENAPLPVGLPYQDGVLRMLLWTAREALSKVLKTGLTTELDILATDTVTAGNGFLTITFRHFMQYKAICWIAGDMACALVLPGRSDIDMAALKAITC